MPNTEPPSGHAEMLSMSRLQIKLHGVLSITLGVHARKEGMELIDLDGYVIPKEKKTEVQELLDRELELFKKNISELKMHVKIFEARNGENFGVGIKLEGDKVTASQKKSFEAAKIRLREQLMELVQVIHPRNETFPGPDKFKLGDLGNRRGQVEDVLKSTE